MVKPTFIQTLLGRPSQSYSFPKEKDYHSAKAHMVRVAMASDSEAIGDHAVQKQFPEEHVTCPTQSISRQAVTGATNVMGNEAQGRSSSPVEDEDEDEEDIFYTPSASPRSSMASSTGWQRAHDTPANESTIATRTPLDSCSVASLSSTSLDGHSLFSSESATMSDLTRATTPYNSDSGHESSVKPTPRPRNPSTARTERAKRNSQTYTDEDWAKDVRWLVPPSTTSSTSSSKSKKTSQATTTATTSYYIARVPPRVLPAQPIPRMRNISKSISKTNPSIMMNMSALLEEEEDPNPSKTQDPSSSVLITGSERQRTSSSPDASSATSVQRSGSTSARRQNSQTKGANLARRKSRSLENLQRSLAEEHEILPNSVSQPAISSLSSFASSSSYVPSLPSSGTPGYTSLTLPLAPPPAFLAKTNKRVSVVWGGDGKIDLTRSGVAQTTMATVEVTKGLATFSSSRSGSMLNVLLGKSRTRSASGKVGEEPDAVNEVRRRNSGARKAEPVLGFTSYRKPPGYVSSEGALIQVWAVGVDGIDAKLVGVVASRTGSGAEGNFTAPPPPLHMGRSSSDLGNREKRGLVKSVTLKNKHIRARSESYSGSPGRGSGARRVRIDPEVGYIPGRSFVGRVLECGWEVKSESLKKGDWVVGLLDVRKCSALQEFIIVDRHRVFKVPQPVVLSSSAQVDNADADTPRQAEEQIPVPVPSRPSSQRTPSRPTSTLSRYPAHTPMSSAPSTPSTSRSNSLSRRHRHKAHTAMPPLTLEELALLPVCGVSAYRAVRTFASAFSNAPTSTSPARGALPVHHVEEHESGRRRRALVLRGHDGVGAMAVQMLVRKGWKVCVHASLPEVDFAEGSEAEKRYMEVIEERVRKWGAEEVVFDDGAGVENDSEDGNDNWGDEGRSAALRVIERLLRDGDAFDAVLDTIGGKEIWEASERLLRNVGVGAVNGVVPNTGMKRTLSIMKKKNGTLNGSGSKGLGQFVTLVGDTPGRVIPTAGDHFRAGLRSLRNTHHNHKSGQDTSDENGAGGGRSGRVGYAWISVAQDVDWEGEDVRESVGAVVKMALSEGIRPWVGVGERGRTVPFERAPEIFVDDGPLGDGGTAVVKIVE